MNGTIQLSAAQLIFALVGAAGIGALVSSLVALLGQHLDRQNRRQELLLTTAVNLSLAETTKLLEAAKLSGRTVGLWPEIILVHRNYESLTKLFKDGKLPDEVIKQFEESRDEFMRTRK